MQLACRDLPVVRRVVMVQVRKAVRTQVVDLVVALAVAQDR